MLNELIVELSKKSGPVAILVDGKLLQDVSPTRPVTSRTRRWSPADQLIAGKFRNKLGKLSPYTIRQNVYVQPILSLENVSKSCFLFGPRVWKLYPLVSGEIGEFDLDRILRYGKLPPIYFGDDPRDDLESYCGSYLQQEIQQEGIVRRIDSFARFLKTAATMNTQLINYEAIASDSAVPARTVREMRAR